MKTIFLINSLEKGGAERVVLTLLKHLKNNDDNPYYLFLLEDKIKYDIPNDIPIIIGSRYRGNNIIKLLKIPFLALKLRRFCRKQKINKIISFLERSNFTNIFTHIIGSDHQCIISERNTPSLVYQTNSIKNIINRQLIKWFYPQSDVIISVSNGVGQDLINNFNIPQDIITTIHNPYDIDNIISLSKNNIDEDWLNNDSYQTILSVGNLSKQKAHDFLLKTFSELTKHIENLRLIIVGEGNEYRNLLSLSKELKIDDHVKFTGRIDNPFAYMARADIFVLSSQYEGFPNVLIEAMICKCVTISTDCPSGPNEIIKDKQNGFLIPVGDIRALKNTIIKVLREPNLRQEITERAYQSAKSFSVNAIIKKYINILK